MVLLSLDRSSCSLASWNCWAPWTSAYTRRLKASISATLSECSHITVQSLLYRMMCSLGNDQHRNISGAVDVRVFCTKMQTSTVTILTSFRRAEKPLKGHQWGIWFMLVLWFCCCRLYLIWPVSCYVQNIKWLQIQMHFCGWEKVPGIFAEEQTSVMSRYILETQSVQ